MEVSGVKRLFSLAALAGLAALCCSCVGPSLRNLDYSDNGSTVKLSTGDVLQVELEANPSTGYLWVSGTPADPNLVVITGESYVREKGSDERVGAPVKKLLTLKAIAPGSTGLKLEYRRPWDRNEKPAKSFEVMLQISGKPLEEPEESDETPRIGSNGKPAKDPAKELFGK